MSVRFCIPRVLAQYASGKMELDLEGKTVNELLQVLEKNMPALHRSICDETGEVRQHIHLFLNDELLTGDTLKTQVSAGDTLSVFQAVSGG